MEKKTLEFLVENLGEKYSEVLKINLAGGDNKEIFKWFLASVLFGAPITETSVIKTYRYFEKREVLTANKILETGWDRLVEILDEGSYARYDFKTATKLLEVMGNLNTKYWGSLNKLHDDAVDFLDLEGRLKELGYRRRNRQHLPPRPARRMVQRQTRTSLRLSSLQPKDWESQRREIQNKH